MLKYNTVKYSYSINMNKPLYDDIGSYPLPEGTTKAWLKEAFADVPTHRNALYELLTETMKQNWLTIAPVVAPLNTRQVNWCRVAIQSAL